MTPRSCGLHYVVLRDGREGPGSGVVKAGCAAKQEDIAAGYFALEAAADARLTLGIIVENVDKAVWAAASSDCRSLGFGDSPESFLG